MDQQPRPDGVPLLIDRRQSGQSGRSRAAPAVPARPRVWPALLAFPLTMGAFLGAQIIGLAILLLAGMILTGGAAEPWELLEHPAGWLLLTLMVQVIFLATALGAAFASPLPLRRRLDLRVPAVPIWSLPLLAVGTLFVGWTVMLAFDLLGVQPSEHMESMIEIMASVAGAWIIGLALIVGVLPGFAEEFLFRGYIQSRLVARWGPAAGIAIAAIMFGIMHLDPQHALAAFVLGLWVGVVAWRSGSVWTAVLCHAFNNSAAVVFLLAAPAMPDGPIEYGAGDLPIPLGIFVPVTTGCFILSVIVLMRAKPGRPRAAAPPALVQRPAAT